MRFNILIGGKAGQGPNFISQIVSEALVNNGYYVFFSRDYQSLIRGGHNFNVITFSDKPVYSNDLKIDILVAIDDNTKKIHKKNINKKGIILEGENNTELIGKLFKTLGLDYNFLKNEFKKHKKTKENLEYSKKGYESVENKFNLKKLKNKISFYNGSEGISFGAIKSGLDVYLAYPMTPATPVLGILAQKQYENNFFVSELENEIAVINSGIGSAITGAKTMIGTSGGGFDLMTEGLSLCGMASVPLVIYLAQRKGPGTGVATYNDQSDLNIALYAGHGEFPRVVLAPGDIIEAQELTNQCFYFSQKFKIPLILLGDKHLGESYYSTKQKPKILKIPKSTSLERYSSYEQDPKTGSATEEPELVNKGSEQRIKTMQDIEKYSKRFEQYKLYGKKNSKNVIISWGSTKGAILDSIEGLDTCFLQILYMKPFPAEEVKKLLKNKNIILVENNSTGMLSDLIKKETGIEIKNKNKILRYDARVFLRDELEREIKNKIKN